MFFELNIAKVFCLCIDKCIDKCSTYVLTNVLLMCWQMFCLCIDKPFSWLFWKSCQRAWTWRNLLL